MFTLNLTRLDLCTFAWIIIKKSLLSQLNKQTRPGEFYHLTANWLQSKKPRDIDFIPSILRHAPTWSRGTRLGCAKMAAIVNEVYCTITIWDCFLEEEVWPSFLLDRERKDNGPVTQFGTTLTQTPSTLNFKINEHFWKTPQVFWLLFSIHLIYSIHADLCSSFRSIHVE